MTEKPVLFISDLHLSASEPATTQLFLRFIEQIAPQAQALYILGDLFESWPGDDDLTEPFNAQVISALHSLSQQGITLYLMHGNRDFLMGAAFAAASGAELLPDPTEINLFGQPTLLTHGDLLCTDDVDYQAFRQLVRAPTWQQNFLAQPLAARKTQIEALRQQSTQAKQAKSNEIMDVNQQAVSELFRAHGYPILIHGHTHRPQQHNHFIDEQICQRWVLPDWYQAKGGYLFCAQQGCRLELISNSGDC